MLAPWGHPVSGGELQRLSVARAVLADRPVLLLDEPTSHLDAATADAVLTTVLERAADRSVLWVTHRPEELARFPEVLSLKAAPGLGLLVRMVFVDYAPALGLAARVSGHHSRRRASAGARSHRHGRPTCSAQIKRRPVREMTRTARTDDQGQRDPARARQPDWLEPELATLTQDRFSDPAWIFERKFDGERCLAFRAATAAAADDP